MDSDSADDIRLMVMVFSTMTQGKGELPAGGFRYGGDTGFSKSVTFFESAGGRLFIYASVDTYRNTEESCKKFTWSYW